MTAAERFAARVAQLALEIDDMSEEGVRRALLLLERIRDAIAGRLSQLPAGTYVAGHLRTLQRENAQAVGFLVRRYRADVKDLVQKGFFAGWATIDEGLRAAGYPSGGQILPSSLVATLQDYSADLVNHLGADALRRVNGTVARAALGVITPYEAQQEIAGAVPGRYTFASTAARAEAIFRTETLRAYSIANQGRMAQMSHSLPGLQKRWVAVDDNRTRPTHFTVGDRFQSSGDPTVVGVTDWFTVGGEKAQYPRDPSLSPDESINCRCVSVPEVPKETFQILGVPQPVR